MVDHNPLRKPPGWQIVEFGEIVESLRNGISMKPDAEQGLAILKISAVRPMNLRVEERRYLAHAPEHDTYQVRAGDLLFTRYNGNPTLVGVCAMVPELNEVVVYPDKLIRARLKPGFYPPFFEAAVNCGASRHWVQSRVRTTAGQCGISGVDLKSMPVPVPPLAEQRRIMAALEVQLTRIDSASRISEVASQRCKRYGQAIAHSAMQDARRLAKTSTTVAAVADLIQYGTSEKCSEEATGVAVLRMGNITAEGRLSIDKLKYLSRVDPKLLLEPGDLLFNRTNSAELVGKSAVYAGAPTPSSFASYLIRVRPKLSCLPQYLALCLNSHHGKSWVRSCVSQQVGQANVSGGKLAGFEFPLPSPEEQRCIMDRVEAQMSSLEVIESEIAVTLGRAHRLRQAILKKAFEGKLVPQDPNDEPAAVLVERIRVSRTQMPARRAPRKPEVRS